MSKYTKDSTRFTATGVWAHTKPGRATTLPTAEPAPKNETPAQKVKRLREAANRAKMAQVTRWDYAYLYGRMAADAAHRLTVYGIIFATGMGSIGFGRDLVLNLKTQLLIDSSQAALVYSLYFQSETWLYTTGGSAQSSSKTKR